MGVHLYSSVSARIGNYTSKTKFVLTGPCKKCYGLFHKRKKKELFLPFTKFISLHKTAPWDLRNDESLWWLWLAESMGYLSSPKVCGIGVGCAGQGFLETSVCLSIASYRDTHLGARSRM